MTKFLALSSLLVISTLTTACSDDKEQVKQLKEEVKAAQQLKPQDLTAEQQELQQLRKRVKQLELERDILKKASALLALDNLNVYR